MFTRISEKASGVLAPRPVSVKDRTGTFTFSQDTLMYVNPLFAEEAETFIDLLLEDLPYEEKGAGENELYINKRKGVKGYRLSITPEKAEVTAEDCVSIFYGLETLRALLLTYGHTVPCCVISDYPKTEYRGFMLDVARHFVTVREIKKLLKAASLLHLNYFHWHLTDDQGWRFPLSFDPKVNEESSVRPAKDYQEERTEGGIYTRAELEEVVAYASRLHITIVPEIETPGHAMALLHAHPEFGCTGGPYEVPTTGGIFSDVLCVGNDEVLSFFRKVFAEVAEIFPGPYIHMGGDECPHTAYETCPKCQQRIRDNGLKDVRELQSWMTVQIAKIITELGRIPVGWDEVRENTDTMGLPPELVVMSWRGSQGGIEAAKRGHRVIMSPSVEGVYYDYRYDREDPDEHGQYWGEASVRASYDFEPVKPEMGEHGDLVLGGQGNLWTERVDFGRDAEALLFPRLVALAESLWSGEKDWESFRARRGAIEKRLSSQDVMFWSGEWKSITHGAEPRGLADSRTLID